jgi:hypothetical protein
MAAILLRHSSWRVFDLENHHRDTKKRERFAVRVFAEKRACARWDFG